MQDPQSLHKYTYVHGDPIQWIDPTGLFTSVGTVASISISGAIEQVVPVPGEIVQSMYEGLLNRYVTNLNWDVDWAFDWSLDDSLHSHSDNSWVTAVLAASTAGNTIGGSFAQDVNAIFRESSGVVSGATDAILRPPGSRRHGRRRSYRSMRFIGGRSTYSYSFTFSFKKRSGKWGRTTVDFYSHSKFGTKVAVRFKPSVIADEVDIKPSPLGATGKRWHQATQNEIRSAKRADLRAATMRLKEKHGGDLPAGWVSNGETVDIPIPGQRGQFVRHTWHHDVRRGRMQLVPQDLHKQLNNEGFPRHVGQMLLHL